MVSQRGETDRKHKAARGDVHRDLRRKKACALFGHFYLQNPTNLNQNEISSRKVAVKLTFALLVKTQCFTKVARTNGFCYVLAKMSVKRR